MRAGLTLRQQYLWCAITGAMLGSAMSVKLTALGVLACVGIHQLACLFVSCRDWVTFWTRGLQRAAIVLSV